jgi:hypothetical protein
MPFQIACPGCQRKYKLADDLRGKPIKCKQCGKAFKIPVAQPVKQVAGQPPAASNQKAPFGLEPLKNESDLFADASPALKHDPLGNHVVANPGFAAVDPSMFAPQQDEEDASDSLYYNPAVGELTAQMARDDEAYFNPKLNFLPAIIAACLLGGVAMLTLVLTVLAPALGFVGMLLMFLVAGGTMFAGEIWLLVRIKNHPYEGDKFMTYFFIAWLRYGFLYQYWRQQKDVGTFYYIAIGGILTTAAMIFIVGTLAG